MQANSRSEGLHAVCSDIMYHCPSSPPPDIPAHIEIESKIESKLKAFHDILFPSA
jgi:hypothetical protein